MCVCKRGGHLRSVEDVFDQIGALREAANDWLSEERPCDLRVFSGLPLTLCLSKSRQLTLWFCSDRQQTSDFFIFFIYCNLRLKSF